MRVPFFSLSDIPDRACGYAVYRGVLVWWDVDCDERVLTFIDGLKPSVRCHLLTAMQAEGCLDLVWEGRVPDPVYADGALIDVIDREDRWLDTWTVRSRVVQPARVLVG